MFYVRVWMQPLYRWRAYRHQRNWVYRAICKRLATICKCFLRVFPFRTVIVDDKLDSAKMHSYTSCPSVINNTVVFMARYGCSEAELCFLPPIRHAVRAMIARGAKSTKQKEEYFANLAETEELDWELARLTSDADSQAKKSSPFKVSAIQRDLCLCLFCHVTRNGQWVASCLW